MSKRRITKGGRRSKPPGLSEKDRPGGKAAATQPGVRLQKYLADRGISSRRKIEGLIADGKIRVDGKVAQLGDRVTTQSKINIDGRPIRGRVIPQYARVILYNKPEGEISTREDPGKRETVFKKLPKIKGGRWISVGRLDINTCGLLLFTNNGELANQLMHPSFGLEREYLCRIFGKVDDDALDRLKSGVSLDDALVRFQQIKRLRGEGSNTWFSVVVNEGKYREVRRMWESEGCRVSRLMRVRYGGIALPKSLRQGEWLELTSTEVNRLDKSNRAGHDEEDVTQPPAKARITPRGRNASGGASSGKNRPYTLEESAPRRDMPKGGVVQEDENLYCDRRIQCRSHP